MKRLKIIWGIALILAFVGCKMEPEDFILNSVGNEWRLDKINGKTPHSTQILYITFHRDNTYDIYYKRAGKRYNESTDIPIEPKWFFDNKGNLHIADFNELKLIQLDNKNMVFTRNLILTEGKEKYTFICDNCE